MCLWEWWDEWRASFSTATLDRSAAPKSATRLLIAHRSPHGFLKPTHLAHANANSPSPWTLHFQLIALAQVLGPWNFPWRAGPATAGYFRFARSLPCFPSQVATQSLRSPHAALLDRNYILLTPHRRPYDDDAATVHPYLAFQIVLPRVINYHAARLACKPRARNSTTVDQSAMLKSPVSTRTPNCTMCRATSFQTIQNCLITAVGDVTLRGRVVQMACHDH